MPLLDSAIFLHRLYVEEQLGSKYVEKRTIPFEMSYQETEPGTPVFFVLSPGVDPLKDVEALGNKLGFTGDNGNFHNVSLGQGQEVVAENALDVASKEGHWVVLQVCACHIHTYIQPSIKPRGYTRGIVIVYS